MTAIEASSNETGFFVTGGTLSAAAPSYVERRADGELLAALHRGEYCYVLNSRQMGKSSLMVRTAQRLIAEGVHVAVLDLTSFGQNVTPEQWYEGLNSRLSQRLDLEDELEDFWDDQDRFGPLQRWQAALQSVLLQKIKGPIIIFVDEIDVVRSLPFSADEFFAAIRQCYVGRATDPELNRLSFCLLGTATPADLIRDTRVTPFNIGTRVEVMDFTPKEAAPLAAGLGENGQALLGRIMYWTNGHPYLTQRLCRSVFEADAKTEEEVDRLCQECSVHKARETDDNLMFVRDRLLKSEVDLASLLDLYRQVQSGKRVAYDETNPFCPVLRLSGVATVRDGVLQVRNRIYARVFDRQWIAKHIPDAELRRQRQAYRSGLFRAAAVSTLILCIMGLLVWYTSWTAKKNADLNLKLNKANSDLENTLGNANRFFYIADMNLIQREWEATPVNVSRVLELLEETRNSKERDFEWYYWNRLCHLDLMTFKGHTGAIHSVAFSSDGRHILTGSADNTAKVWDAQTGKELLTLKGHTDRVVSVAFSSNGKSIVTGSADKTAKVWDVTTGKETFTFKGHTGYVESVAFSSDGRRIVSGSSDKTAKVWDATTGKETLTLKGHTDFVFSAAFSSDSRRIVTGCRDGTAKVWDATTGKETLTLKGHTDAVESVAFSLDGSRIVTGSWDKTAKVWDAITGKERLTLKGHTDAVWSVAFSSDKRWIVTGSVDKTAKVWDAATEKEKFTLKGHKSPVLSVAISSDGRHILTGSADNTAKVWDAQTGKETRTLLGHTQTVVSVAISLDGRKIVTGSSDGTAKVWDTQTGKELLTLKGHTNQVLSVAFSPDGKRIVTGSYDNTAKVWDVTTGKETLTLKGHTSDVHSVAFSSDGKRILTGSGDTAKVWFASAP